MGFPSINLYRSLIDVKNGGTAGLWQRMPITRGAEAGGSEFQASLLYRVYSRAVKATQGNPVSKKGSHPQ